MKGSLMKKGRGATLFAFFHLKRKIVNDFTCMVVSSAIQRY